MNFLFFSFFINPIHRA